MFIAQLFFVKLPFWLYLIAPRWSVNNRGVQCSSVMGLKLLFIFLSPSLAFCFPVSKLSTCPFVLESLIQPCPLFFGLLLCSVVPPWFRLSESNLPIRAASLQNFPCEWRPLGMCSARINLLLHPCFHSTCFSYSYFYPYVCDSLINC